MPFPLLAGILGASTVVGGHLTRQFVVSGARKGLGTFAQALPFGAGYSFGTYIGFPKNYARVSNTYRGQTISFNEDRMSYYQNRRYSQGYNRYPPRRRRYRRYNRRYRSYRPRYQRGYY